MPNSAAYGPCHFCSLLVSHFKSRMANRNTDFATWIMGRHGCMATKIAMEFLLLKFVFNLKWRIL